MKNTLCALALAAITAGCATPQASIGTTHPTASNVPAYYCAKDRLNANGALLECNWQATIDEACTLTKSSALERASLASDPQPAGRCNSGQWLVKATPR